VERYRIVGITMRLILLFLLGLTLVGCATVNQTYTLPTAYTYPEERNVLVAWPIEPVDTQNLGQ